MSEFKCKNCGGSIEFKEGETVGVCSICGAEQSLPADDGVLEEISCAAPENDGKNQEKIKSFEERTGEDIAAKKRKKLLIAVPALVACIAFLAVLFCIIIPGRQKSETGPEGKKAENNVTENIKDNEAKPVEGDKAEDSKAAELDGSAVAIVNGENITRKEFNYFLYSLQRSYEQSIAEQGGDVEKFFENEHEGKTEFQYMKENAYKDMIDICIFAEEAKKAGVTCTKDEIDKTKSLMTEGFADENEFLTKYEMDKESFDKVAEKMTLFTKYRDQLMKDDEFKASDEEIMSECNKIYMRAKHILFATTDDSQQPLSEVEKAEKKKLAEEILAKVKAGEDFDSLMAEYSEDPGSKANPEGYTFTEGQMVSEFEDAVKALGPGEVSGIVESQFGYHIIKRLGLDIDKSSEEYKSIEQNLAMSVFVDKLYARIEEWKNGYNITENKTMIDSITRDKKFE